MSIIWTNIQFVEDIVDSIHKTDDYSFYERYMKFGTQLSNLMNFYNTGQEKPNGIHVDHSEQHRFLFDIVEHAKHKQTYIQAFVFGFISQHILEQKIKPYLNHIKRDINCDFINTEALIDTLIMKKTYNVHTWKIPVYNEFNIGLLVDKKIVSLLSEVNHPIADHIHRTYVKFNMALRYYFDPYGWKSKLFPSFRPLYPSYTYCQSGFDLLNENHKSWYNDMTKERSTFSFFQIYELAKLEASTILCEVHRYWNNPNSTLDDELKLLLTLPYRELRLKECS